MPGAFLLALVLGVVEPAAAKTTWSRHGTPTDVVCVYGNAADDPSRGAGFHAGAKTWISVRPRASS